MSESVFLCSKQTWSRRLWQVKNAEVLVSNCVITGVIQYVL